VNPFLIVLLGWLCVGLEAGVRSALVVRLGSVAVGSPSFVVPLVTVIALCAPPLPTLWACMGIGLLVDLTSPVPVGPNLNTFIIGPNALGLAVAAQFVLAVRGVVIRRNPISVVVLSAAAAAISGIVVTALLTARHLYDPIVIRPTEELMSRLFSALLTCGTAFVMSFILLPMSPMLGLLAPRNWVRR
jgi:hypothetical protein